jgi:outer membrane biosynthesis protein TonB
VQGNTLPTLTKELGAETFSKRVAALKMCITESGAVERVLVLASTGNQRVDEHLKSSLMKWRFAPVIQSGSRVRSVSSVSITLESV